MLEATSQIEEAIPAVSTLQERYDAVSQRLPQMLSRLLVIRGRCAFISDVLDNQETAEMFNNLVRSAASAAESLQGFNARLETGPGVRESCRLKYDTVRNEYLRFCLLLKAKARKDLGVITPSS